MTRKMFPVLLCLLLAGCLHQASAPTTNAPDETSPHSAFNKIAEGCEIAALAK